MSDQDLLDQIIANDALIQKLHRDKIAQTIAEDSRRESGQDRASRLKLLGLADI